MEGSWEYPQNNNRYFVSPTFIFICLSEVFDNGYEKRKFSESERGHIL